MVERALDINLEVLFLFLALPTAVWPLSEQSPSLSLQSCIFKITVLELFSALPVLTSSGTSPWKEVWFGAPQKKSYCRDGRAAGKETLQLLLLVVTMKIFPLHVPNRLVTDKHSVSQHLRRLLAPVHQAQKELGDWGEQLMTQNQILLLTRQDLHPKARVQSGDAGPRHNQWGQDFHFLSSPWVSKPSMESTLPSI